MPQPEQNLWKSFKQYLPKKSHWNRIENRTGTGMPDVYLVIDGVPCWFELKVIKKKPRSDCRVTNSLAPVAQPMRRGIVLSVA